MACIGYHRHSRLAPPLQEYSGKEHVVITGANSGVGYALTHLLMARGISAIVCRSARQRKEAQTTFKAST